MNITRTRSRLPAWAILALLTLALASTAYAALGGDESSVQNDRVQMKAAKPAAVQSTQNYTVHEITTGYGTVVREYLTPDGKVFGVAWRGPFMPNLQQLFGSYYDEFVQNAKAAREAQVVHSRGAPLRVEQPDLVVHSAGRVRAYAGQAYLPGLLPAGVDPESIK
jgi:hypothetical protein